MRSAPSWTIKISFCFCAIKITRVIWVCLCWCKVNQVIEARISRSHDTLYMTINQVLWGNASSVIIYFRNVSKLIYIFSTHQVAALQLLHLLFPSTFIHEICSAMLVHSSNNQFLQFCPRTEGIYFRHITSAQVTIIMQHFPRLIALIPTRVQPLGSLYTYT